MTDQATIQALGAWLLEQIGVVEGIAKAAGGERWHIEHQFCPISRAESGAPWSAQWPEPECECCVIEGVDMRIYDEGGHSDMQARHIVSWDPQRVLADCHAKRVVVTLCAGPAVGAGVAAETVALSVLQLLAQPFAECDGYREEWAVPRR